MTGFHRFGRRDVLAGLAALLTGAGLSTVAWSTLRSREDAQIATRFQADAAGWHASLQSEVNLFLDVLNSIRVLHAISDTITPAQFQEFVTKGMVYQQQVLGCFGFAQRVDHAQRSTVENAGQAILESAGDNFRTAAQREVYFPLTYLHPADSLPFPLGFDFASEPSTREAIAQMSSAGAPVVARALGDTPQSLLVFTPVLYPAFDANQQAYLMTSGFAFGVLRPDVLVNSAIPATVIQEVSLSLSPLDQHAGDLDPGVEPVYDDLIRIGASSWVLRCAARPGYTNRHRSAQPETVLAGGCLASLLLALLTMQVASRARRVRELVDIRTRELRDANQRLEEERAECLRLENEILQISSREKQSIGQDLHDSLGQKLAGAVFVSRALASDLAHAPHHDEAIKVTEILKDAVSQVRRMARGLAPIDLGPGGLPQALHHLADEACDVYGIVCSFRAGQPAPVPKAQAAIHLFHIAQEAVNNAVRHGGAKEISIDLSMADGKGRLTVRDNGKGFEAPVDPALRAGYVRHGVPDLQQTPGLGLRIMKYRASMIGGTVTITSSPGNGTSIECLFPIA